MNTTVEYINAQGETQILAEGDGFIPIPNVGDQFSYDSQSLTVKARSFTYYDEDNGDLAVTITLSV